jgi:hypothetical protein
MNTDWEWSREGREVESDRYRHILALVRDAGLFYFPAVGYEIAGRQF